MISNMKLGYLTDADIERLLDKAYSILENTGADVHYDKAVALLEANGCTVENGMRVKIPRELIKKAFTTIPEKIQFYNRDGSEAMCLTGRDSYFGSGPTCCFVYDAYTGERRVPQKQDAGNAAKVVDALHNMDFAMSLCTIGDQTPILADVHEMDAMLRNTRKPISTWAFNAQNLDNMLQLASVAAGGKDKLVAKPNIIIYNEPTTPLVHTLDAMQKLFLTSEFGIPAIYSPGMLVGVATPASVAGALVVGLADCFVGLLLGQLINPGCPAIAGIGASPMDMMTMQSTYGDPAGLQVSLLAMKIYQYLKLPTFDMAGATDSKCVDAQAGIEATMRIMACMMNGGNMIHDCGFMDMGMIGSLSLLAVTDEIVGMCRHVTRGVDMSDDAIAMENIDAAGPGGNHIEEEHTFEYFRQEFFMPSLLERRDYTGWHDDGSKTMAQRAEEKVRFILENHQVAPLPQDVTAEMDAIVAAAEASVVK